MTVECPLVVGFDMDDTYSFIDMRSVSPIIRDGTIDIQREAVENLYPPELLCSTHYTRAFDRRKAEDMAAEGVARLEDKIEEFKEIDCQRHSVQHMRGEVFPLTFSIFKHNQLWGAWQWYGIYFENENIYETQIKAGWFPAYPSSLSQEEVVKISIDMVHYFLDNKLRLYDGRYLTVIKATAPIITIPGREDTKIIDELKLHFNTRSDILIDCTDEGHRQSGRESLVVTRRR